MTEQPAPSAAGWPAQRLAEAEPARLIIWTDDDLAYANRLGEIAWAKGNDRIVCVCPSTTDGLTDHQLDLIAGALGMEVLNARAS